MMPMKYVLSPLSFACVVLVALAGCGAGFGDVSGKVTFKGKPFTGGVIVFYDAQNGAPSAEIKEDGSFIVKNVGAGPAKVTIVPPLALAAPGLAPSRTSQLPVKYASVEESGLTFTIKRGPQTIDIPLE